MASTSMFKCARSGFIRVVSDIVCILIVSIAILVIFLGVEPYHRGFFCNDESLKHPYHDDTVPIWVVGVAGMGLPIIAVLLLEALHEKKNNIFGIVSSNPNEHGKSYGEKCYKTIMMFMFGAAVTQFLTEVGKNSIGRLRPHFFSVCNLDMSSVNCSQGYVVDFTCRETDKHLLKQMRLSFPSGHASIAIYCMLFMIAYLQARLTTPTSNLIRPVIQLTSFSLAFYTCLSRISDYKHHWSDVLGGAVLGITVCMLVIAFLCNLRMERRCLRGLSRTYEGTLPLHHPAAPRQDVSSTSTSCSLREATPNELNTVVISSEK